MKNTLLISSILVSGLVLSGCGSAPAAPVAPVAAPAVEVVAAPNDAYAISAEFATAFTACEANPTSCELDRDAVIEGTITKIYVDNGSDFSNFVDIATTEGTTSTIPVLPDSQQKRATIIVDTAGDLVAFEDIKVGDSIKANVKSFDIIEAGQIAEKLGQYGYIQITAQ